MDWFLSVQTILLYLVISSGLGIIFRVVRKYIFGESDDHMPFIPAMICAFRLFRLGGGYILELLQAF